MPPTTLRLLQVVEQGPGQYFCEYDGTTLSSMVRRYIFSARIMDESGEATVQVFNEQAEQLLAMKADELAELRESGEWWREREGRGGRVGLGEGEGQEKEQLLDLKADELAELRE